MKNFLLLSAVFILATQFGQAQSSTITFNVNLKGHLEDSVFIPNRDYVQVKGNFPPLTIPVRLVDTAPIDSIFTGEVTFSQRYNGKRLEYNYELVINYKITNEDNPRSLILSGDDEVLPPLFFNAFAW